MESETKENPTGFKPWEKPSDPGMIKYFDATVWRLKQFDEHEFFVAQAESPAVNGLQIWAKKGNRCFEFFTQNIMPTSTAHEERQAYYKPIMLSSRLGKFTCPNGFGEFGFDLTPPNFHLSGDIREIECMSARKSYFRYVVEHKDSLQQRTPTYLDTENFSTEKWVFPDLHAFKCNGIPYHFYEHQLENKIYHFIDSMEPVTREEFEKVVDCTNVSLGFIAGFVPLDERFIFQSPDVEFKTIDGFSYKRLPNTIKRGLSIVDKHWMLQFSKEQNVTGNFTISMDVFSNLVNHSYQNQRFKRTLQLITDANPLAMNIKASTYYVALETLRTIIVTDTPTIKPIKEDNIRDEIREKLKKVLAEFDDNVFNDKQSLLTKIDNINSPLNKSGFIKLFEQYGFELTQSDEVALEMRNKLLHGDLPYEDSEKIKDSESGVLENEELTFFTFKIRFLISVLVMKYSGYSGYLLNLSSMVKFNGRHKDNQEPRMRLV